VRGCEPYRFMSGQMVAAMYSARFPKKINSLVLAEAPIDISAGRTKIKKYAHTFPMELYEELVALGGGILKGKFMLQGFKNMHPQKQYFDKFVELYDNIHDPKYVKRFETFERWYEYTIDLPGKWYLQVIKELFKENRLFKGNFIALGRKIKLRDIIDTAKSRIVKDLAAGGHVGLFMGSKPLRENWPKITKCLRKYSNKVKKSRRK
jgi:poly(3-hydroxyalkanoate) synthetase